MNWYLHLSASLSGEINESNSISDIAEIMSFTANVLRLDLFA
jgi:hypothetical protein